MYEAHWNITHRPFENWGDSRYFFPSEVHQAALLQLRYAIESRRAAVAVCGDSGMGKTLLIDTLVAVRGRRPGHRVNSAVLPSIPALNETAMRGVWPT